jgi:hypothetical protein
VLERRAAQGGSEAEKRIGKAEDGEIKGFEKN